MLDPARIKAQLQQAGITVYHAAVDTRDESGVAVVVYLEAYLGLAELERALEVARAVPGVTDVRSTDDAQSILRVIGT
jgi:hypothetical protein